MSEKLSSKNLFHFTGKSKLKSILRNKFYAMYSEEDILNMVLNKKDEFQYIPMVSFCDIPLTMLKNHCKLYGSYGIGLTKEWAMRNKINPVVYCHSTSTLMNSIRDSDSERKTLVKEHQINKKIERVFINNFINLLLYLKPITGKNKINKPTLFYDEKEWRYIPSLRSMNNIMISCKKLKEKKLDFRDSNDEKVIVPIEDIKELNSKIFKQSIRHSENYKLNFEIDDIKFIILKRDNDIPSIIKYINNIFNNEDESKRKILVSKILTLEQFKDDF